MATDNIARAMATDAKKYTDTAISTNQTNVTLQDGTVTPKKMSSDFLQTINDIFASSYNSFGINDNGAFRGWCTPFKAFTKAFDKIILNTNITANTTLTCEIRNTSQVVLYSKTVNVTIGTNLQIEFNFLQSILMTSDFYVFIYAPTNTSTVSFTGTSSSNYDFVSDTLDCKAIFKTTSGNTSLYTLGIKKDQLSIQFINTTNFNMQKLIVDESQIKYPVQTKTALTINQVPPFVYTAVNDINTNRNYSVDVYLDHMFNVSSLDNDLRFTNGLDHISLSSPVGKNPHTGTTNVQTANVVSSDIVDKISSNNVESDISITKRSIKSSLGSGQKSFVLCIGDSQTMYGGTGQCNGDKTAYWGYVAQLFDMDIADGSTHQVTMLGSHITESWDGVSPMTITYSYKDNNRTIKASAEGIGNWSLLHHLRYDDYIGYNQSSWDKLELGNGTHTDYTDSQAQRDLIVNTCQPSTSTGLNVFFDPSKTGTNRFSITKWLERYRTMDDNGNRLYTNASGSTTKSSGSQVQGYYSNGAIATGYMIGSLVTDTLNHDVCTPTHIILMHGRNTLVSPSAHATLLEEFIDACQAQVPTAKIGICLHPDQPGTYFPDNYVEIIADDNAKHIYNSDRANQFARMQYTISQCQNRESENVYLIPAWFCMPTAYSWALEHIEDGKFIDEFKKYQYAIAGGDYHPSGLAHMDWAYQIYCWIKYTYA